LRLDFGGGWTIPAVDLRIPAANVGVGGRLCRARAKKMNWAYVLCGVLAAALLVYLLVAMIWAEDL
jgi:K+-transporting ATPase KdpF subunit